MNQNRFMSTIIGSSIEINEEDETDPFFQDEIVKYKKAKRWLATMMGEDPETFTQKEIDEAIQYLLPSHLWAKDARPQMKHPYDTFPRYKELEYDKHGRPVQSAFYSGQPMYQDLAFQIWSQMEKLDSLASDEPTNIADFEDADNDKKGKKEMEWVSKLKLQQIINEKIKDKDYDVIKYRLQKLSQHERADEIEDFLGQFQVPVFSSLVDNLGEVDVYEDSARSMGYRKKAIAEVSIRPGTGMVTVNTRPLCEYFKFINEREQIMFPLLLVDGLDKFDVECHVIGGGVSGKSGAIRLGLSRAVAAFCPEHFDVLNDSGLLTRDARRKERKKPGRKKARRRFQWVKR